MSTLMSAKFYANETDLSAVCAQINARIANATNFHIIFLLSGDIGAGKTTLVREFAKNIGISDSVTSPTFSLLHIYKQNSDANKSQNNINQCIFHYDLFNRKLSELLDLGLLDLLEQSGIHFVEWGDLALLNILKNAFENIYIISIHKTKNARIYEFKENF